MSQADFAAFWGALNLGWFFLLRAGEYPRHDGQPRDVAKALSGMNVDLVDEQGDPVPIGTPASGVVIRIIGSKTDIYNISEVRKHFVSGDPDLCPVRALEEFRRHFPARFDGGPDSHHPLCRWANGDAIYRTEVAGWLERGAASAGVPPSRMGSHSQVYLFGKKNSIVSKIIEQ